MARPLEFVTDHLIDRALPKRIVFGDFGRRCSLCYPVKQDHLRSYAGLVTPGVVLCNQSNSRRFSISILAGCVWISM